MVSLPWPLYACEQVKKLDHLAILQENLSPSELMQRAAIAAWNVFREHWPDAKTVAIVCGQGNNGGDGYELACLAKQNGLVVNVYDVAPAEEDRRKRSPETQQACQKWLQSGGNILSIPAAFNEAVIVDALLGTGVHFPVGPIFSAAIQAINHSQNPVLAIDIPSGLNGDTGVIRVGEPVVKATVTVTFVGVKVGLISHQGNEVVGKLHFDPLGISEKLRALVEPVAYQLDYSVAKNKLNPRSLSANKGDQGHVLIIGAGKAQFGGAVCLAGEAALRAGAGLVSVIVAPESMIRSAHATSELMMTTCTAFDEVKNLFERAKVILLGPGLSQNAWGEKAFHYAIKQSIPMVIDADGLNWLAQYPEKVEHAILTPHPGEAARLLNTTVEAIQQDRVRSVKQLQAAFGGVIVLKGAGTLVMDPSQRIEIMPGAFPALATGGTGDVLAGVISALLAQGLSPFDAAKLAVCTHAMAGEEQGKKGIRGMIASDLFLSIRRLLNPNA